MPQSLDHPSQQSPPPLYLPSKDSFEASSSSVISEFLNFESILELEADTDWEVKVEKPNAYIMIRTGTPSHPNIPIMKAFFDLELEVDPQLAYSVIYDPQIRKKWDRTLAEYEILRNEGDLIQYYMRNTAPWPFDDRDFVETRYIRKRNNGDLEVYFRASFNENFQNPPEKTVRGEVVLGGQIFRGRVSPNTGKNSLIITTIVQADLKGEVPKKLLKVSLPASVFSWFRSVKKQVEVKKEEKQG
jgi:hypothetical protein